MSTEPRRSNEAASSDAPGRNRGAGTVRGRHRGAWRTVAVQEVLVRATSRAFVAGFLLTLAVIVGGIGILSWMQDRDDSTTVAVVGASARQAVDRAHESGGLDVVARTVEDPEAARTAVRQDDAELALWQEHGHWVLASTDGSPGAEGQQLSALVASSTRLDNAQRAGVSAERLEAGTRVEQTAVAESGRGPQALILGTVFVMLFYFATLTFGVPVATSVLEEKSNRIVEIIAASVPVSQVLIGKLVANIGLALAQMMLFAAAGLAAMNAFGLGLDFGWVLGSTGWFLVFFVLGFSAMAALYAVAGSMADRTEDLSAAQTPIMVLLMAAYFGGFFAHGTLQTVLSYVPVLSSVSMPMRLVRGDAQWWEALVSAGLAAAALALILWWAARVYRRAVMRTGTALSWARVLRNRY